MEVLRNMPAWKMGKSGEKTYFEECNGAIAVMLDEGRGGQRMSIGC